MPMLDTIIDLMLYILPGSVACAFLLLWAMGPEGRAVLKAKTRKRPLAIVHRPDRKREFKVVDRVDPEKWHIKPYGDFETVREAIDLTPSHILIADVYANVGATIPPHYAAYTQVLKNRGVDGFAVAQDLSKKNPKDSKLSVKQKVFMGKMFDWQGLLDFLPIAFNPAFIWGAIERGIRVQTPKGAPWSVQKIMAIGMVIFITVIAIIIFFETDILSSFMGGGGTPTPPGPVVVT